MDRTVTGGLLARLRGEDRGSVSLLVVVLAVGLLAMVGLVVDRGGKARAAAEADDVTRAAAAARAYLTAAGVTGTVTVAPGGLRLTVTTTATYTPVLLSAIGIGPMPVTGAATADLVTIEGAP